MFSQESVNSQGELYPRSEVFLTAAPHERITKLRCFSGFGPLPKQSSPVSFTDKGFAQVALASSSQIRFAYLSLHIVVVQRDLKCDVRSQSGIAGPDRSQLPLTAWHSESSFDYPQRSSKYLNNLIEQDHRRIKQRLRPILGLKSFETAPRLAYRRRDNSK